MNRTARQQAWQVSHAELLAIVRQRRRELGIDDPRRTKGAVPIGEALKNLEHKWRPLPALEAVK